MLAFGALKILTIEMPISDEICSIYVRLLDQEFRSI